MASSKIVPKKSVPDNLDISKNSSWLTVRTRGNFGKITIFLIALYWIVCYLIAKSHVVQTVLVFMHIFDWPEMFGKLTDLNAVGLVGIAKNIAVTTPINTVLHGYHIYHTATSAEEMRKCLELPYISRNPSNEQIKPTEDICYDYLLANSKRILMYFHGNSASRGLSIRVEKMKKMSMELDAHVIVFDYSGFADSITLLSDGHNQEKVVVPSEESALIDSIAMLGYVNNVINAYHYAGGSTGEAVDVTDTVKNGSETGEMSGSSSSHLDSKDNVEVKNRPYLYVYGHSLGTAISTALIHHVHNNVDDETSCAAADKTSTTGSTGACEVLNPPAVSAGDFRVSGLILDAPFTSVLDVLTGDFLIRYVSLVKQWMLDHFHIKFPTIEMIPHIHTPLLIFHGTYDAVIPVSHGREVFETAVRARESCKDRVAVLKVNDDICAATTSVDVVDTVGHNDIAAGGCVVKSGQPHTTTTTAKGANSEEVEAVSPTKCHAVEYVEIVGATHNNLFRYDQWAPAIREFFADIEKK